MVSNNENEDGGLGLSPMMKNSATMVSNNENEDGWLGFFTSSILAPHADIEYKSYPNSTTLDISSFVLPRRGQLGATGRIFESVNTVCIVPVYTVPKSMNS
jgi:hypothetical protein